MSKRLVVYCYMYQHEDEALTANIGVTVDDDVSEDEDWIVDAAVQYFRENFNDIAQTIEWQGHVVDEDLADYIAEELDFSGYKKEENHVS